MAEIEFRLPSTLQYAYVGVKGTPEEIGQINYELLASLFANAAAAFGKTEREAWELIRTGAQAPVSGPPVAPRPEDAKARLEAGQKPRTVDEANAMVAEVIERELGTTELENVNEPPARAPKAWEKPKPKAKATINFDDF